MFPLFLHPTFLLMIPAFILIMYAQSKVKSTFKKYSSVRSSSGMTGAEVARRMLRDNGIDDVPVERTEGNLTDHYDPKERVLRLSENVYGSDSLSALGVAAHEAGHAVQDARGYTPMKLRQGMVPVATVGNNLGFIIFFVGLLFVMFSGPSATGMLIAKSGIALFAAGTVFTLLTLPVEFNASSRALDALGRSGFVNDEEKGQTKEVLNAAALTYVAAAFAAVMMLLRLILLLVMVSGGRE